MKCPYCNNEMEDGYIYGVNFDTFPWLPHDVGFHPFLTENRLEKFGGLNLTGLRVPGKLEAYLCRKCGKGIFDFKDGRKSFI